jgi:hypothetical protein
MWLNALWNGCLSLQKLCQDNFKFIAPSCFRVLGVYRARGLKRSVSVCSVEHHCPRAFFLIWELLEVPLVHLKAFWIPTKSPQIVPRPAPKARCISLRNTHYCKLEFKRPLRPLQDLRALLNPLNPCEIPVKSLPLQQVPGPNSLRNIYQIQIYFGPSEPSRSI